MDGGAVLVEQTGLGERIAAGARRAERHSALRELAQRGRAMLGDRVLHVDAAADEQRRRPAPSARARRSAKTRGRCSPGPAHHRGSRSTSRRSSAAAQAIGHAQRLDGAGQRDHRIVTQREKPVAPPLAGFRPPGEVVEAPWAARHVRRRCAPAGLGRARRALRAGRKFWKSCASATSLSNCDLTVHTARISSTHVLHAHPAELHRRPLRRRPRPAKRSTTSIPRPAR